MISTYKQLLALACVLVLLVCGLAACKSEPGAATTAAPLATEPAQDLPLEVYWNLDQELYDGKSEAGMSSRMPESDGYFHVRLFKDGQTLEVKVADRRVINHLDTLTMMGLEFDENGIVVDGKGGLAVLCTVRWRQDREGQLCQYHEGPGDHAGAGRKFQGL